MIKNQKTNSKAIEGRIIENFRNSGLTQDQYLNSCKQILFVKRNNKNFAKLILEEKEEYLTKNNILGYRFLGDKHLIEIFDEIEQISLTDIYLNITPTRMQAGCNLNFNSLLKNCDNILIAGAESFLNQVGDICSTGKKITLSVIDLSIKEILDFDFGNYQNVTIESRDIYNEINSNKYSYILCIPPFGLKRMFEKGKYYGNDSATIAAEILFENNLTPDGTLTIIMPNKVNFSQTEVHFRRKYEKNLAQVVKLQAGTFNNTNIITYLYIFKKDLSDNLLIADSLDVIGEKYNIADVTNADYTWDFEKPFKEVDEDIQYVLNNPHKKLSEITSVLRGKPLPKYAQESDNGFTYIDMRAIKENFIDYSEAKIYEIDKDLSSEYLQDDDILIPNKGNISKVVLYKNNDKNCIASANLLVIRANKNLVEPEYLLTYLRSKIGQKLITGIQRGAAMPFINHEDLKGIAVILPDLEKQQSLIKNYQNKMQQYKEQLAQAQKNIADLEQAVNDTICGKETCL